MHMKQQFRRILSLLLSTATILTMSGLCLAAEQDDGETPDITLSDTSSIEQPSSSEDHIDPDSSSSSESSIPSSVESESEEVDETLPPSSETPAELTDLPVPVVKEYSTDSDYVKSNVEYDIDAQENPDIWGDGTVDWAVPEEDGSLEDLTATNVYPASTLYFPLGKDMYTKLKIGTDHLVALQDLDIQWDDDYKDRPFLLDVDKTEHPELINEIRIITEKKLDGKLTRTCYLKIKLNDSDTVEDIETTGTIKIKAQKGADSDHGSSTYQTGDTIEFNYSLTISNKSVNNGSHVQLGDRIYMQPDSNATNKLIWDDARAALQFITGNAPDKFYVYLTTKAVQKIYQYQHIEGSDHWFYDFSNRPTIPASSATLTLGIPWSNSETAPPLSSVYIYQIDNKSGKLTDITNQFTYSKDGALIQGWSTTVTQLGSYLIAGRNLLYTPPSGGGSSGGHSGGGGGGGGGKGGGSSASANLVKAATVTKSATAAVTNSISNALKANLKTTAANIPITAGTEISPATVKSVVKAINAAAKNKGVVITPAMTLTKTSAGKFVSSISFNPMKFISLKNVQLGVALDDKASRTALSKLYRNNMQMVKFTQTGTFGMDVAVTAKLNLASLNTKTLQFYTYDRTKKTLTPIATPNYSIDKNGYLHFTTNMGNTVVITDSVLQKKT